MTPSDTTAVLVRGGNASLVVERLAARRQRVRTIRKWVVTFAVALFLAVTIVIVAQSRLASTSSATTSGSSTGSGAGTSSGSSTGVGAGTWSSSSTGVATSAASPVTSSQS